ncbi:ABC transporter ATP-binding protein [Azospirillum doebereinerae]|uniref:ABC transporter ATP-binding protein n=1 Tax=Azospirillum doebereinerae TaxID=92933 RepID=UPI001EE545EA|nr:ABC transporter ATP-binding protein [Azospirillum doebereinerae]MCG5242910.1 ABC transporter ATP-binding protein [Azospirillum doebereinerae]
MTPIVEVPIVEVQDFGVAFGLKDRPLHAVRGVNLTVRPGEIIGIAGESGSGKSTLCTGLIRALAPTARVSGRVCFDGRSLYDLPMREVAAMHGRDIAMVLQNPMTSLDPLFTIGNQVREVLKRRGVPGAQVREQAIAALKRVHITAPEMRVGQFPHQLSGGMRQRVLIAMATSASPRLLVADEPTSALDATIQDEILLLFRELRDRTNAAVLIVTHELEVIRRVCDRVLVMYAGRIVEQGPVSTVFAAPQHPYTRALLASTPRIEGTEVVLTPIPGQVPDLRTLGPGCAFADRCPHVVDPCRQFKPEFRDLGPDHRILCRLEGGVQ